MTILVGIKRFLYSPPKRMLTVKLLLGSVAMGAFSVGAPIWAMQHLGVAKEVGASQSVAVVLLLFNLSDLTIFLAIIALALVLVVHHVLWSTIKRPLYSLQRLSVFSYRKTMCGVGVAFVSVRLAWGRPSVISMIEFVKKML